MQWLNNPKVLAFRQMALMFLPFIGYSVGDWLVDHWAVFRALDLLLKPYAFNASLLIGLGVGLAQLAWSYSKTHKLSSYVLQQLALLLAFTLIPLRFGHYVHGLSIFGLLEIGMALCYLVDYFLGGELFLAYPEHFSPHMADRLSHPAARASIRALELVFVLTMSFQGGFVTFGNALLPKSLYLLALPFVSKGIWVAFAGFCMAYGKRAQKRGEARRAALSTVVPAAGVDTPLPVS